MRDEISGPHAELVLAEDDPDDRFIIVRALRRLRPQLHLAALRDGIELIAYLQQQGDQRLPHLVLLDLNMPRMDGREVLTQIKGDSRLQHIAVVVLTTSIEPEDRQRALALKASGYFSKPDAFTGMTAVLRDILDLHLPPALLSTPS